MDPQMQCLFFYVTAKYFDRICVDFLLRTNVEKCTTVVGGKYAKMYCNLLIM